MIVGGITLLLVFQLAGEVVVRLVGLPIPGPVIGMLLLFVALLVRGRLLTRVETTAQGLLGNLALLFVPAGVGVMLHLPLIAAEWVPIATAVLGGTVITIAVTALLMKIMAPAAHGPDQ